MKRMCVCVRNSVLKHGCLQKGIKRYQFSWTDLNGHADHASACFPELTRSATLLLQENNAAAVTHIPCVLLQAAHVCVSRRLHRRFFFFFLKTTKRAACQCARSSAPGHTSFHFHWCCGLYMCYHQKLAAGFNEPTSLLKGLVSPTELLENFHVFFAAWHAFWLLKISGIQYNWVLDNWVVKLMVRMMAFLSNSLKKQPCHCAGAVWTQLPCCRGCKASFAADASSSLWPVWGQAPCFGELGGRILAFWVCSHLVLEHWVGLRELESNTQSCLWGQKGTARHHFGCVLTGTKHNRENTKCVFF